MGVIRSWLVTSGQVKANAFAVDNAGLSPFMQRRIAHANCLEGLPIFGGLMLVGAGHRAGRGHRWPGRVDAGGPRGAIADPPGVHQPQAVTARFSAFAVQMGIAAWWCWRLWAG